MAGQHEPRSRQSMADSRERVAADHQRWRPCRLLRLHPAAAARLLHWLNLAKAAERGAGDERRAASPAGQTGAGDSTENVVGDGLAG